ncbi:MAG TPA: AGE family epimerase/isomerase [Bryobacteraceae bacterium]|nr:AGE family epimerase/isomerase [Bryobacteraceae bacterium]
MNRRTFSNLLAGAAAIPTASAQAAQPVPLDLAAMRDRLHRDLFDDYLPFIEKYVVDPQYGGFMCSVRPNGERVSTGKTTWYEGRGTWVFSFLYNNFSRDPKYVDIAERSVRLVQRSRPKNPDEFWPKGLTREGEPTGPPDTEVYSDMFLAEGFAEFSKASGDRKYWDDAKEIVLKCVRRYDQPDYHPSIGQTYLGPGARPFPGARVEGVWMVLIRTTTQMLAMRSDAELQQISRRAIDALLNHHYNPRFQLLNELINHDLSRPANEYERLVYAGHAIETLWMVMDEARRVKDSALFDRAAGLFRRHCEVAKDRVYGGLFRNLRNVDKNDWTMDKTLFPHQEALNGGILLIEETGDPWAVAFYSEIAKYTRDKFPMRAIHSPLWQVMGDRQVHLTPNMTRAENYHQPRFLMLNLLAVERMIKRNGVPVRAV